MPTSRVRTIIESLKPAVSCARCARLVLEWRDLRQAEGVVDSESRFAGVVAREVGAKPKTAQRWVRWSRLGEDLLKAIEGTERDRLRELDDLTAAPPPAPSPPAPSKLFLWDGLMFIQRDVQKTLESMAANGFKVGMVLTDPPYGIDYTTARGQKVLGDDKAPLWCIEPLKRMLKPGGVMALWSNAEALYDWTTALSAAGLSMVVIPWDKIHPTMSGRECVIIASEGRPAHPPFSIRHLKVPNHDPRRGTHATPKPHEIMAPLIETYSMPGEYIVDPFAGLAPVGVAALRLGRGYIGAEMDTGPAAFAIAELRREWSSTRDVRATLRRAA